MWDSEPVAVEVNQRCLVDKVLTRYPEEFAVFRELLQNADDAEAKDFVIDFQTRHVDACMSNGTKSNLDSVKVSKWLVKNNGAPFEKDDWTRLTKIADGNPDERKIGAFGVGFYSVFSVTNHPIVKSNGKMMSMLYKDGRDHLYVKEEECNRDHWTVIEIGLKKESSIPRTFELTRFLVTSMTFLVNIQHVTISLDDRVLSTVTKSQCKSDQSIPIPKHMARMSPEGNMSINSVELITQEVKVKFVENPLVGAVKIPIARVDLEECERKPTELPTFFPKIEDEVTSKKVAAPRYTGTTSEAPSINASAEFSAKCYIYSAKVNVTATPALEKGLESATKKKPPKDFSSQIVFFSEEEHDRHTQEDNNSEFGSVFRGPQGLCPWLQGEHAARIFIGQSTTQTTGLACHISGRFIPTVERGSIDLVNGHVAKWNTELLYVGGFLARIAYDSEMNKLHNAWSTLGKTGAAKEALYTMKTFTFHPSTPDSKVSGIIKHAFFACSETDDFLMLSDQGIRHTKEIRHYNADFASFMRTPVLPVALRAEIASIIGVLPDKLRVRSYSYQDVFDELKSRWLTELEMAACLRWWTNACGSQGPLKEGHNKFRDELLKFGKAVSRGKEIKLSAIRTFIDGRMLNILNSDDPLPEDTIPPPLIQGLVDPIRIQGAFGWQEMPITHWLRHLKDTQLDEAYSITRAPNFASHMLTVLSTVWNRLIDDSNSEVRDILEDVACIPTTSSGTTHMLRPNEVYFPEADVFHDLPVVRQELLVLDNRMIHLLEYLGVQKICDINTFIRKAIGGDGWDARDLARYLAPFPEHARYIMGLEIFPGGDGVRRCIQEVFASTDINRQLGLPVVNYNYWDSSYEAQFLVHYGLRQHPTIEELIPIASNSDPSTSRTAFALLCGPLYEATFERDFDPSKFSYAFIPGFRNGKNCLMSYEEVFSDPSWILFGFGRLSERLDKKVIQKLKIRDRPSAAKLFQVLASNPPKDARTATEWFQFLAVKGVFSAGEFDRIADLKIIPVPKLTPEQQESECVSPRECFLKSKSDPEDLFYQRLFKFVDFGPKANEFLRACGVKERPECIDILKVLLNCPQRFYDMAGDHEKYLAELRMIAVGYKSLPKPLLEKMHKVPIFLGCRRSEGRDKHELCKADEVFVADDMESYRTFGGCIFTAPQEELLEKFYSEMLVKSLSSCIKYTVKPIKELPESQSLKADKLRKSIIEKIPIFLHEFDEPRFRKGMYLLRWHDDTQFSVRACGHLRVTKRLDFKHGTEFQGWEQYDTDVSAETRPKGDTHVLWIKESKADSYDIAAALCRMLFSAYKKNDVLSLMTILDTSVEVLERRGYDVQRILKEYEDKRCKDGQSKANPNVSQAQTEASPPKDGQAPPRKDRGFPRKLKKLLDRLRKDPKLGEVKQSDIEGSIKKVKDILNATGGEDSKHPSDREQVGGGRKQKNVAYCNEKRVAENDLEECVNLNQTGQIKVWKLRGTILEIPSKECDNFVKIISELAQVFEINQTRCHVFYHTSDSSLMGFNRNDQVYFGLEHYIQNYKEVPLGKAYIDWYYIMAHEMAHVHTPYHDEHHELLFAALTKKYLTVLHNKSAVQEIFDCQKIT